MRSIDKVSDALEEIGVAIASFFAGVICSVLTNVKQALMLKIALLLFTIAALLVALNRLKRYMWKRRLEKELEK